MKTVSARIRQSKTELDELGESYDDLSDGFSKYRDEILQLTGFDIMEEGTTDDYKSLYDIFDGIAQVWGDLTETQQSRVSEILGGTRQLQVISSIINNWDDAASAYAEAMDAAGTATEAQDTYMTSLNAKIDQFNASVQELYYDFLSSDLAKGVVDFGTSIIQTFDKIVDSIGSVTSAIMALGAGSIVKSLMKAFFGTNAKTSFSQAFAGTSFGSLITGLTGLGSATTTAGAAATGATGAFSALWGVIKNHPLGTILSVIGLVAGAIALVTNNTKQSREEIIAAGEDAQNAIDEAYNEYQQRARQVDPERYGELALGVNTETNENISLTSDEYQKYLSLCNEIADIYPQLVTGYTEQGDAILNLGNNAELATQKLTEMLEADKLAANLEISDNLGTSFAGIIAQAGELKEKIDDVNEEVELYGTEVASIGAASDDEEINNFAEQLNNIANGTIEAGDATIKLNVAWEDYEKISSGLLGVLQDIGLELYTDYSPNTIYDEFGNPWVEYEFEDSGIAKIQENIDQLDAALGSLFQKEAERSGESYVEALARRNAYQRELEGLIGEMSPYILSSLETNPNYDLLSDDIQNGIADAIDNISWNDIPAEVIEDPNMLPTWAKETFLYPITDAFNDVSDNEFAKAAQDAYGKLFSLDTSELTNREYITQMNENLAIIQDYFKEFYGDDWEQEYLDFTLRFGFNVVADVDEDTGEEIVVGAGNQIRNQIDKAYKEEYGETIPYDLIADLTEDQMEAMAEIIVNGDIFSNAYKKVVEDAQSTIDSSSLTLSGLFIDSEGKQSDFSKSIDDIQSKISSLNGTLDDVRNGENINWADLIPEYLVSGNAETLEQELTEYGLNAVRDFVKGYNDELNGIEDPEQLQQSAAMIRSILESLDLSSIDFSDFEAVGELIQSNITDAMGKSIVSGLLQDYYGDEEAYEIMLRIALDPSSSKKSRNEWKEEIEEWRTDAKNALSGTLSGIFTDTEFSDAVDKYKDDIKELNEAMTQLQNGEQVDLQQLVVDFPELSNYVDNLEEGLSQVSYDEIKDLGAQVQKEINSAMAQGMSESEAQALNDMFAEWIASADISGILPDDFWDQLLGSASEAALPAIQDILDKYGENELTAEIFWKMTQLPGWSDNPEEWLEQFDKMYEICIVASVNTSAIEQLQDDLSEIQTQADDIQNEMSRNETLGIKNGEQMYRDLINNGNLQLQNLQDQKTMWEAIVKVADPLSSTYAEAESEIANINSEINSVISSQYKWNAAADALLYEAGEALSAYNEANSSRNAGDNYLDMMSAFEAANDLFEKGLIGEDDFLKAAAMASPSGIEDVANWAENYSRIMRYMNEEDGTGVLNFLEDLSQKTDAVGESMATYDAETDQWSMNINDLQAAADALNIPLEVTEAIIGRGEDYGLVNNWFATTEDGIAHIGELYSDLADQQYKLDQMRRNGASQEEIDSQEDIIATTKRSIEESKKLERQYKSEAMTQGNITQEELANAQELVYKLDQLSEIGAEYESEYLANVIEQLGEEGISEIGGINVSDLFVVDADGIYHLSQEAYNDFKDGLAEEGYELYPESAKVEIARNIGETLSGAYEDSESDVQQTIDRLIEEYDAEDFLGVIFNDKQYTEGLESLEMEMDDLLKQFGLAQDAGEMLGRILASYKETGNWTEAIEHVVEEIEKEEEIAEELSHPYSNAEIEHQADQTQEVKDALIQPGEMQTIRLVVEAAAGNEEELELLLNKEPEELEVEYNLSPGSGQSMHDLLQEEYDELQHQQELEENTQEVPIELVIMNPDDFDQLNDLLFNDETKEISLDVFLGEGGLSVDQLQSLTSLLEDNLQEDRGIGIAINFTGDVDADNFETLSNSIEVLSSLSGVNNISTDINITTDNVDADQINSIAESMEKLSDAIGEGNFNATVSISANDISIDDLDSISEDIGRISEIVGAGNVSANIGITTIGTDLYALEKIVDQKDNIKELSEMEDIDFNISIKVNGEEIEDIDKFEEGLDTFTSGYEYIAGNSNLEETDVIIEKVGDDYAVVQGAFTTPLEMAILGDDDVEDALESVKNTADKIMNAPKVMTVETLGAENAETSFDTIGSEFDSLDGRVLTYSFQEDNGDLITLQDLGGGEYAEYTNGEFTVTLSLDVEASGMSPEEYFADLYNIDPVTIIVTYETAGDYPSTVPDADGVANYTLGTYPTSVPSITGTANYTLGIYPTSLPTITQTVFQNVITHDAAGTAHAEGTASLRNGWGNFKKVGGSYIKGAYAGGSWSDWSLHSDEDALVNELGTESIVIILRLYIVICIENLFNCWEIVKPIKL